MDGEPMLKPVVVTRAEERDGPLSTELKSLGLPVLVWAAVRVLPADAAALDEALGRAASFDWIVFTSRHAVAAVTTRLSTPPAGVRTAAVGRATAAVLKQHGWPVDLVPGEPSAAGLVAAFAASGSARSSRVLYPASSRALPTLAAGLHSARRRGDDRRGISDGCRHDARCRGLPLLDRARRRGCGYIHQPVRGGGARERARAGRLPPPARPRACRRARPNHRARADGAGLHAQTRRVGHPARPGAQQPARRARTGPMRYP